MTFFDDPQAKAFAVGVAPGGRICGIAKTRHGTFLVLRTYAGLDAIHREDRYLYESWLLDLCAKPSGSKPVPDPFDLAAAAPVTAVGGGAQWGFKSHQTIARDAMDSADQERRAKVLTENHMKQADKEVGRQAERCRDRRELGLPC